MDIQLLLDTHVWLWLISGEKTLSSKSLSIIQTANETQTLYLSDISLWEMSMLASKNRIILNQPVLAWIHMAIKLTGVRLIRLTSEICVESTELPGMFHGDPADRLIVATARVMNLHLMTRDAKILEYGHSKFLQVLAI